MTTVPQLFVRGAFIGDCERVVDLHRSGELLLCLPPDAFIAADGMSAPQLTEVDASSLSRI